MSMSRVREAAFAERLAERAHGRLVASFEEAPAFDPSGFARRLAAILKAPADVVEQLSRALNSRLPKDDPAYLRAELEETMRRHYRRHDAFNPRALPEELRSPSGLARIAGRVKALPLLIAVMRLEEELVLAPLNLQQRKDLLAAWDAEVERYAAAHAERLGVTQAEIDRWANDAWKASEQAEGK